MLRTIKIRKLNGEIVSANPQKNEDNRIAIYAFGSMKAKDKYCYWRLVITKNDNVVFCDNGRVKAKKCRNSAIVAQFLAIIVALEYVSNYYPNTPVEIINNYPTAVDPINGKAKCNARNLLDYCNKAKALLSNVNAEIKRKSKGEMRYGH